jgi:hypothetical protein
MKTYKTVSTKQLDYLAKDITDELMRNDNPTQRASRLQLRGPHEEDYGGYCRDSIYKIIRNHIEEFWSVNR